VRLGRLGRIASAFARGAPRDDPVQFCEVTTMTDVTSSTAAVVTQPQARARQSAAARQARWRKNNSLRRVELYLRPETVERLDKLAREAGAFGRAEVVEARFAGTLLRPLPVDVRRELLEAYQALWHASARHPLWAAQIHAILGQAMERLRQSGT
jgi:hypothetical protein